MPEDPPAKLSFHDVGLCFFLLLVHTQQVCELTSFREKRQCAIYLPSGLAAEVVPAISFEADLQAYAMRVATCSSEGDE